MSASELPRGLSFRRLTEADARVIAEWRYDGDYAVYDPGVQAAASMLDPAYEYYAAVARGGELVGYCCFGADARVPGLAGEEGVLDVGGGLRPDLTGIGLGAGFLRASCELGKELHSPLRLRVVVAAFNRRAQRVAAALGFDRVGVHSTADRDYVLLERSA